MSLWITFFILPFDWLMKQYRDHKLLKGIAIVAKQLREDKGLSQEDVMNEIKIQSNINIHIGRIETAVGNMTISNLSVLCNYYNISLSKFFSKVEKEVLSLK